MSESANASKSRPSTSILEQINSRLAHITPEQLRIGPPNKLEDAGDVTILGVMTTYQRKLWTLMNLAIDEYNEAAREAKRLRVQLDEALDTNDDRLHALKDFLHDGLLVGMVEAYETARDLFIARDRFYKIVRDLFWNEIQQHFHEAAAKSCRLSVFGGWSVGMEENAGLDKNSYKHLASVLGDMLEQLGDNLHPESVGGGFSDEV